jgi:hypothetical protein
MVQIASGVAGRVALPLLLALVTDIGFVHLNSIAILLIASIGAVAQGASDKEANYDSVSSKSKRSILALADGDGASDDSYIYWNSDRLSRMLDDVVIGVSTTRYGTIYS